MRRFLLMCVACVRGVREWSRCSPLHPAAPLRVGHDVRHLARSRRDGGLRALPVPLPTAARTANSSTSPSRRRPALTASLLSVHVQAGRARRRSEQCRCASRSRRSGRGQRG